MNHLQTGYPICIANNAPGGASVRRIANSQSQQNFLIPNPSLTNITHGIFLTIIPYISGGIPNPGDKTNFIHIRFPKPAILSPPLKKQLTAKAGHPFQLMNSSHRKGSTVQFLTAALKLPYILRGALKRGSIFNEFINSTRSCNPTIDPLVAASLAAQGLQWWVLNTQETTSQWQIYLCRNPAGETHRDYFGSRNIRFDRSLLDLQIPGILDPPSAMERNLLCRVYSF